MCINFEKKKIAVVTGSTTGIGKEIGFKLLENNYFVVFNYSKNEESANKLEISLKEKGYTSYCIIKADLSSIEGADCFISKLHAISKEINILVLNAGITVRVNFQELSFDEWMHVMNTNLNIPYYIVQKLNSNIAKKGKILFIGSILGKLPHATSLPYGVSKSAVAFLAKSLVKEFADREISINAIMPGFVDTQWQGNKQTEIRESIENKIALKRFAHPQEIAQLCYDVIKNEYINGSCIDIDGGYNYC